MEKKVIPDKFFHILASVLPRLNRVLQECGISMGEWMILWYIQQNGVRDEKNQLTILRQDLSRVLAQHGQANITRMLNDIQDKLLIRRGSLTTKTKNTLFHTSVGGRRCVTLLPAGEKKILKLKEKLTIAMSGKLGELC